MNKRSILFLLILAIITISFAAVFVKWSEAPATIISMYRMYFASILLLPFVIKKRGEFKRISKKSWVLLATSGIFLAAHFALWFGSLKLTTVASSTIILALQPIVALVGGFLVYKERTSYRTLILIGIAIFGVALVGWGDFGTDKAIIIGDILSFLSVIAVVHYLLIGQSVVKKVSHWIYSFCVFFFAGVSLTIYNLLINVELVGYGAREWGIFLLLAIFPTVAHVIFNLLLNYVNTTTISMCVLGEPVGATILAALLLNEQVSGLQIIGGLFALLGVFLFLMQRKYNVT
ncbi:DMT family transporter [Bacillus niameyensis]|uniref:DMT family transporter n=1 Tax=Bacillus niameyensis TaxID=1522308 RepID=UPI0007818B34|nr:DMT family transporter [Bacillus niameyensis]